MVSRHLIVKVYLWFLLTLSLTVAGAFAVVVLIPLEPWGQQVEHWASADVAPVRDLAQTLLTSGASLDTLRERLRPALQDAGASLAITDAAGRPLLVMPHPLAPHNAPLVPNFAELRLIAVQGSLLQMRRMGQVVVGLPIRLPQGSQGVFFVTVQRRVWQRHPPLRLLAGLAIVLAIGLVLCWPLARHITQPMQRMALAADALGKGDLRARIDLPRRDELGQLAQRFNGMADNLQRLVEGHKRLLADISHELRSPLARLQVALALAHEEAPGKAAAYLDRAARQAEAIDAMIGELLAYSRLELTPYALRPEPIELGGLVAQVLEPLQDELQARRIAVRREPSAAAVSLAGDRALLQRALANVLRNALAYSPNGAAISVHMAETDTDVELAITDQGPGIPADQREAVFKPFVRTDAARQRHTGGVGLGLAIVRLAVEAHGGKVWAEAGPGERGLCIRMRLPRHAEPARPQTTSAA